MFQRRLPDSLRHDPTPGVRGFAILSAFESTARGILISVYPVTIYRAFQSTETVSEIYLVIGFLSFLFALSTPWISMYVPRRWLYTISAISLMAGALLAAVGSPWFIAAGLSLMTVSTVVITVCFNAYVMDYISRSRLGEVESMRLFYSGAAWTIGPVLGVWLMDWWQPAPFLVSALASLVLLAVFWTLRLGNGKVIARARSKPPNPLAFIFVFLKQPRLITGWTFAVVRSSGWWVYIVYVPIFAVENGFSEQLGGIALSISNGLLFITPLILKWINGRVRYALKVGVIGAGIFFLLAAILAFNASVAILLLIGASFFLIMLDVSAGLPFLMAVKPSQRTEMSAVYATYRDVSGIIAPGVARLTLLFAPLAAVFIATAAGLFATAVLANRLHPRLGKTKPVPAKQDIRL